MCAQRTGQVLQDVCQQEHEIRKHGNIEGEISIFTTKKKK